MKRFISMEFFLILKEASQKGIDIDIQILECRYNEFVMLLFQDVATLTNKTKYHSTLIYTYVEFTSLTEVAGKKCGNLFA